MSFKNVLYFLNNLKDLIVSILRTLNGTYTSLLMLCIIIYVIITVLLSRVISLPCKNCDNGGWWYKCWDNTGKDTHTCKIFEDIIFRTNDVIEIYRLFRVKSYNIVYSLLDHTHNVFDKTIAYYNDILYAILSLNPATAVFVIIYNHVFPNIIKGFAKLFKVLKDLGLKFTIPLINVSLDIGEIIKEGISFALDFLKELFKLLLELFSILAKIVYDYVIKPILSVLFTLIGHFTSLLHKLFGKIIKKFDKLLYLIKKPIELIQNINISDLFMLIMDKLIGIITSVFGIPAQFINLIPFFIYLWIILFVIFTFIVPPICLILIWVQLIKDLIYLVLNCEDDEDFTNIIITILNKFLK